MVSGFNLSGFSNVEELFSINPYIVKSSFDYNEKIKSYIVDKEINAESLQNDIFPVIGADIFISHSHSDEELAIKLKNWLQNELGITSFLDGEIWKSADETLKAVDDIYCWRQNRNVYDYSDRNLSTSYVHVMLCNAIMQVMDKCKFVFFLNTNNSIKPESAIKNPSTHSPWLYYELSVLKYIEKKSVCSCMNFSKSQEALTEDRNIRNVMNYPAVDLANLPILEFSDLKELKKVELIKRYEKLEHYFDNTVSAVKKRI